MILSSLRSLMQQEYRQLFTWIPVLLGIGIAWYFALHNEPERWVPFNAFIYCVILAWLCRNRLPVMGFIWMGGGVVALGFMLAMWQTQQSDSPVLERSGLYEIEGHIITVDSNSQGVKRFLIALNKMDSQTEQAIPKHIRVMIRTKDNGAAVGDRVRLLVKLSPPPRPVMPEAYNFARKSYFQQLGAVGFAVSEVTIIEPDNRNQWHDFINRLRDTIAMENERILSNPTGAVASALMVGKRYAIDDQVMQHIRDAGIAHILAISGLHMVIVMGFCFVASRKFLAISTRVAVYYPTKKIAAMIAIMMGGIYLLLSGIPVSASRAFIMSSLYFLAILLDREPRPMHSVAWAALVILAMKPSDLLSPGFQMSFAAVVALIASYSFIDQHLRKFREQDTVLLTRLISYVGNMMLSSLIAGVATMPFSIYHFNHYSAYGVLTNLLAIPLTTLWIMPLAMISLLLSPVKLAFLTLIPMGWGIDLLVMLSKNIASLPYADRAFPSFSGWLLGVITVSVLWLSLWHTRLRLFSLPCILASVTWLMLKHDQQRPHIIISGEDKGSFAIINDQGEMMLSSLKRQDNYEKNTWKRRLGLVEGEDIELATHHPNYSCDRLACHYRVGEKHIAFIYDAAALIEDCEHADLLINFTYQNAYRLSPNHCSRPRIINRYHLWKNGGYTIRFHGEEMIIKHASYQAANRPWSTSKVSNRKKTLDQTAKKPPA